MTVFSLGNHGLAGVIRQELLQRQLGRCAIKTRDESALLSPPPIPAP